MYLMKFSNFLTPAPQFILNWNIGSLEYNPSQPVEGWIFAKGMLWHRDVDSTSSTISSY